MREREFSVGEVLSILMQAAEALEELHSQGTVVRKLVPWRIAWSVESGVLTLWDGEQADGSGSGEWRAFDNSAERSLLYIAPEQTNPSKNDVDARADLYALGAIAWQLLVGRPLFQERDTQALIHAHLASRPEPPHLHRAEIPLLLSEVVLKLLAKRPEERYQTARSLKFDLQRYVEAVEKGEATHFALGQYDKFVLSLHESQLYGRKAEQQRLLEALQHAQEGELSFVLIGGASGVGKTSLARWLAEPTYHVKGHFARGRFELRQADVPFFAFQTALRSILEELLAEERARFLYWRARTRQALGNNDGVLCSLLPELRHLLGDVSEVTELPAQESQVRVRLAFASLFRAIASPSHPLVLFLDDLQWADSASLELLEFLVTDEQLKGLVLLGGYRNADTGEHSLLPAFLNVIEERDISYDSLLLSPLSVSHIQDMLVEMCGVNNEGLDRLAAILEEKTAGNPFFVQTLLQQAYREQLLWREASDWSWNEEELQALTVTDNVVALLLQSLQQQPQELQEALQLAACLGHRFEVAELASLLELEESAVLHSLQLGLREGLLLSTHDAEYRFAHDRVQEAAFSLMTENEQALAQLRVGRYLLSQWKEGESDERLYEIVGHIQKSGVEELGTSERVQLAELALRVGRNAQRAGAFESALGYLQWGALLLGERRWEEHYALTLSLMGRIADVGPACRNRAEVEPYIDELLQHGRSLEEQLPGWQSRCMSLIAEHRMEEAIDVVNSFFKKTGTPLIQKTSRLRFVWDLLKTFWILGRRKPEDLVDLPLVEDPLTQGILDLQIQSSAAYNLFNPGLAPTMILRDVRGVLQHGLTMHNIQAWSGLGGLYASVFGKVDVGLRYSVLLQQHLELFGSSSSSPQILVSGLGVVDGWVLTYLEAAERFRQIKQKGFELGSLAAAYLAWNGEIAGSYQAGRTLSFLRSQCTTLLRRQKHHSYMYNQGAIESFEQFSSLLVEDVLLPSAELESRKLGESSFFNQWLQPILHLHLYLLSGQERKAFELALPFDKAWQNPVNVMFRGGYWTYALLALFRGIEMGWASRWKCRKVLRFGLKQLRGWAKYRMDSRGFRLHWVKAAELRSQRQGFLALEHYDKALAQAKQEGFVQDAALIAEHAMGLCDALGHTWLASRYHEVAVAMYGEWGASAKVNQLMQHSFVQEPRQLPARAATTTGEAKLNTDEQLFLADVQAVLHASEALSEMSQQEELLQGFLTLVIQHSGAERGLLFLQRSGSWRLAAQVDGAGEAVQLPDEFIDLDSESLLVSTAMLRYAVLSRESIVLHNAMAEGAFVRDPYVVQANPRSVCCRPVQVHGQLLGVLVLENRLSVGVFSQQRLDVLRIIVAQAALSLDMFQGLRSGEVVPPRLESMEERHPVTSTPTPLPNRRIQTLDEPLLQAPPSSVSVVQKERPLSGCTVGDWLLIREMAKGGMSAIFESRNTFTGQRAALKLMLPDAGPEGVRSLRFEREAKLLERLDHPNVVDLLDFDRDPTYGSFLALEYLEGENLQSILERHAPLPLGWWLPLAEQLCEALSAVHQEGVLHRDLKPSNLFVSPGDPFPHLTLLDFGIADDSAFATDTRLTSTGAIVGTPAYLAPEQLKEKEDLTVATDLYAMGVLWFEALTGEHPMGGGSSLELFVKILQEEPRTLGDLRPEFRDTELEIMLQQLLSKSPKHRPRDVGLVWNELSMSCQFLEDPNDSLERYPIVRVEHG